ncbi:hypothetical protein FN846DRAFT_457363 [Sphaerosporella brunnea]|uniref:Uncharacterized protein n=1 Tax=Sphaerosporella brunnea TaxID=1250544 RepID=A0A5J5EGY2_9PEZI|nr:hypothetical protein FN846DRAFT_457363 [Sphaerosporella brunnea]
MMVQNYALVLSTYGVSIDSCQGDVTNTPSRPGAHSPVRVPVNPEHNFIPKHHTRGRLSAIHSHHCHHPIMLPIQREQEPEPYESVEARIQAAIEIVMETGEGNLKPAAVARDFNLPPRCFRTGRTPSKRGGQQRKRLRRSKSLQFASTRCDRDFWSSGRLGTNGLRPALNIEVLQRRAAALNLCGGEDFASWH